MKTILIFDDVAVLDGDTVTPAELQSRWDEGYVALRVSQSEDGVKVEEWIGADSSDPRDVAIGWTRVEEGVPD